ncbi:hypothetical protein [Micromonospora musae]
MIPAGAPPGHPPRAARRRVLGQAGTLRVTVDLAEISDWSLDQ